MVKYGLKYSPDVEDRPEPLVLCARHLLEGLLVDMRDQSTELTDSRRSHLLPPEESSAEIVLYRRHSGQDTGEVTVRLPVLTPPRSTFISPNPEESSSEIVMERRHSGQHTTEVTVRLPVLTPPRSTLLWLNPVSRQDIAQMECERERGELINRLTTLRDNLSKDLANLEGMKRKRDDREEQGSCAKRKR